MHKWTLLAAVALTAFSSVTYAQDVEGSDEALRNDAAIYAKAYGVSQQEAERRVQLMVLAQSEVKAEEAVEGR